jgi:hypothetical protein
VSPLDFENVLHMRRNVAKQARFTGPILWRDAVSLAARALPVCHLLHD